MISYNNIEIIAHGKWILTGEHSVLRGYGAIVYPIKNKILHLKYKNTNSNVLHISYNNNNIKTNISTIFQKTLKYGLKLIEKKLSNFYGCINIYNNIPIGMGMGSSAAISFVIAKLLIKIYDLQSELIYPFAKKIEMRFHKKSSGIDIIGVSSKIGTYFENGKNKIINQTWKPKWFLSSCGKTSKTSFCINKVNNLWKKNKKKAKRIDIKMKNSVTKAIFSLEKKDPKNSIYYLAQSIQQAHNCFKEWGLINTHLKKHINLLLNLGAITAKPTGSGLGGYVISLWKQYPPKTSIKLISV
ncbi:mevalonate kinase [Candidatus Legionella polyplacis]|uniref:mevalonate kinase n=1 Tax=Candidatus Legionella polyplacis TaxID=2005262 RepID=A0ABZ2GV54_9GAMM